MALSKVTYVDGVTIIGAQNLNDIQDELIRQGEQQAEDEAELALKANAADVQTALALKADKSDTYTKAEVNEALGLKANTADVNEALALKADKTETYTKAQVDSIVEDAIAEAVKESEYSNFEMKSVSGDFIHITDGAGLIPVKDLKIGIEAVQEGTGDPSPENIRPITGWTGARVTVAGKNLFSNVFSDYMKPVDYYICPIKLEKNTYYSISATKKSTVTGCIIGLAKKGIKYTEFGDFDTIVNSSGNVSSYIPKSFYVNDSFESPKLIVFCSGETQFNQLLDAYDIQLERGNTVTAFEPYKGKTYEVSWQTEAGTVYGGTLDVTTGELVVTHGIVDLRTVADVMIQWNTVTSPDWYGVIIRNIPQITEERVYGLKSDIFASKDTNIVTSNNIYITGGAGYCCISASVLSERSLDGAKAFFTNNEVHVVYPLATPQTYQLTPTEVLTLLGENNIFADTGAIEELIYRISRQ